MILSYSTLKWVKPEDLNPNGTLFGGRLLAWIDEEAALFTITLLESTRIVTKHFSEINFKNKAKQGDFIEIVIELKKLGLSSIALSCSVKNKKTGDLIITIPSITMVHLDKDGKPIAHNKKLPESVVK